MPQNKSYGSTGRGASAEAEGHSEPACRNRGAVANAKKHVNEARKR
jgi:hypothetical protein